MLSQTCYFILPLIIASMIALRTRAVPRSLLIFCQMLIT
jgi:hypothetical protein